MRSHIWQRIIQRFLYIIPVVFLAVTIIFFVSHLIPGDPARLIAGEYATEDQVAQIRKEYNLDRPLLAQYVLYLRDSLTGDFGVSMSTRRPVIQDIKKFFPATIELAVISMFIVILVGVPFGVVSAVRKDQVADHAARLYALGGVAIPVFWLGILLQLIFYYKLGWIPAGERLTYGIEPPSQITGLFLIDSLLTGNMKVFADALHHMVLPAVILSTSSMSSVVRQTRGEMLKVLKEDYVTFHTAYGLPKKMVIYKYALRNALTPTVSLIGLVFGLLLGGSFLVETVCNWPGLGSYVAQAVLNHDFPAIIGATLVMTFSYAFVNLFVDITYAIINPRVRI